MVNQNLDKIFYTESKTRLKILSTTNPSAPLAFYIAPNTQDENKFGSFYFQSNNPDLLINLGLESLFLHEAIPGHHYQISTQQELKGLCKFRKKSLRYPLLPFRIL